jgi:hypothetical protein
MQKVYVCFDVLISLGCVEAERVTDGEEVKELVEDSGERRTPSPGFLRKDVNRKGMQTGDAQGCDSKGVRLQLAAKFVVETRLSGSRGFVVWTGYASEADENGKRRIRGACCSNREADFTDECSVRESTCQ